MLKRDWEDWYEKLQQKAKKWLKEETQKVPDGFKCKRCGADIMNRRAYFPVHDAFTAFKGQHAGSGKVENFVLPECPTESCPNHKPKFWNEDENLVMEDGRLEAPCVDI